MTPAEYAEHEEFTALKMQVSREMFPVMHAMLAPGYDGQPIRVNDAAPRFANPDEAHEAFKTEVQRRWNMRAGSAITSVIGSVADIQRLIDKHWGTV